MTISATQTPITELSFEQALLELEDLTRKLEAGAVPLETSIQYFERGAALKLHCESMLKNAQLRVEQIVETQNGIKTENFEGAN
jgi:exodeoxyribonuclease VII small subunit